MSEASGENPFVGRRRPDMLPPDTDLVGREEQIMDLRRFVAQGKAAAEHHRMPVLISIYGEAGVGKSALGTSFAYLLEDQYPHGALYVDLNASPMVDGKVDTSQILRSFLLELLQTPGRLPQDARDLPRAFVNATDKLRLIVFLDNVREYESVSALIPRSSTCLVILTSHQQLKGRGLQFLQLKPLPPTSAVELFQMIAPSRDIDTPAARAQLTRLLDACDGLPIAIRVLAARLADNPGYTMARILADLDRCKHQPHLTELFGAGRHTIEACFRVSYDALNKVQSMLFRRLSLAPGESFDVSLGAYLGDLTSEGARLLIEELRELQLIEGTQDPDYFTMHTLWGQFAREQLGDTEAAEQLTRTLTFYCEQAEDADQAIRSLRPVNDAEWPSRTGQAAGERDAALERDRALDWMEKQHKNLVAAVKRACDENEPDIAWRTCRALVEFSEIRGEWESWGQTHEAAERIVPQQSLGLAHLNYGLGRLHGSLRDWPRAIARYRTAIAVFRFHDEQVQVGRSLNSLGDAYRYMRNWDAAENCFRRSLEILEEAHHPRQVAIAKRSMSTIHRQRGQFTEAEQLCLEAIKILQKEEQRDDRWLAATRLSLADIYLDSGYRDARELLEESLEVFIKLEDTHWIILTRRSLGEALREEGDYDAAMRQLELCQQSLRNSQDDHWEGQILHSMGLVHLEQGDTERAQSLFDDALAKFRQSHDILWEGRTHMSLGRTAAASQPDTVQARLCYHAAWPLLVEQGAKADLERLEALLGNEDGGTAAAGPPGQP
jgi:tetratricopeptide (TPR) repeat protein